jgi:hypothetical protein
VHGPGGGCTGPGGGCGVRASAVGPSPARVHLYALSLFPYAPPASRIRIRNQSGTSGCGSLPGRIGRLPRPLIGEREWPARTRSGWARPGRHDIPGRPLAPYASPTPVRFRWLRQRIASWAPLLGRLPQPSTRARRSAGAGPSTRRSMRGRSGGRGADSGWPRQTRARAGREAEAGGAGSRGRRGGKQRQAGREAEAGGAAGRGGRAATRDIPGVPGCRSGLPGLIGGNLRAQEPLPRLRLSGGFLYAGHGGG